MATTADPPGYNISDEEQQQQQQQQQQIQDKEEYNARRRNRNSMFVDNLRSKKRHLETKQQQQRDVIIAASSSGWVPPERLKTIDRDNPNQPKNIHMSKQTKEIHRNSIPRTSWEPYSIPKKRVSGDHAFSSTTNDWVPSKYYSKNNGNNQNLHPQLNRNNVVTSSYPPNIRPVSLSSMPLVTTSKSNSNSNSIASQSTTLANNNNSINNIVGTVSNSNSDIEYDIETVNSGDSFDEYTEYNDKSTNTNINNVLLTDHFKVNDDDDINAGVSFTVDRAKIDVSKRSLITTDFTESFAFTSFNNNNKKDKTSDDSSSSYLVIEISDCSSGGDNFASFASFPSAAVAAPAPGARTSTDPPAIASAAAALAAWSARSLYSSSSSSSSSLSPNKNDKDNENDNDDNSNNSGIPQSVSTLIMIKRKRDFLDFRCCCRVIDDDDDDDDDEQNNEQDNSSDDDADDDNDDEKENNGDRRQQRNQRQRQRQRQRHGRICQPLSCGVWMIVSLSIVLLLIWIAIGIGWYFMKPFE